MAVAVEAIVERAGVERGVAEGEEDDLGLLSVSAPSATSQTFGAMPEASSKIRMMRLPCLCGRTNASVLTTLQVTRSERQLRSWSATAETSAVAVARNQSLVIDRLCHFAISCAVLVSSWLSVLAVATMRVLMPVSRPHLISIAIRADLPMPWPH
jgi:hypothetical protein